MSNTQLGLTSGKNLPTQVEIINLITKLTDKNEMARIDPRLLNDIEKDCIIEYLRYNENFSYSKIATVLHMDVRTIISRATRIDETFRARIIATGIDPYTSVAELQRVKSIVQQKAAEKKDWGLVWRTELETVETYMKLGILKHFDNVSEGDLMVIDAEFEEKVEKELGLKELTSPKTKNGKGEVKRKSKLTAMAIREKLLEERGKMVRNLSVTKKPIPKKEKNGSKSS